MSSGTVKIDNIIYSYSGSTASVTGNTITSITNASILSSISVSNVTYNVTSIGINAFRNNLFLRGLVIPDSVTSIGNSMCTDCINLTSVTLSNTLKTMGISTFYNCTSLLALTIPDSVTSIGNQICLGCTSLTSVTLSNTLKTMGISTFYNCTSLPTLTIPNSVTSIGMALCYNCTSLTSVTFLNTLTVMYDRVFRGCTSLKNFTIPNSVTSIEEAAFRLSGITSITIPSGVTNLALNCFRDCSTLSFVLFEGDQPSTIGTDVFTDDPSLNVIYYSPGRIWPVPPEPSPFGQIPVEEYNPPPPANICFPAGTRVKTDQGLIEIDKIDVNKNTIHGEKIIAITKTINTDKTMVRIEKNALGKNVPNEVTIISNKHKLWFNDSMIEADKLVEMYDDKVRLIKYNGEILYNVLLKVHNVMMVNNVKVETLDPSNDIAEYYINEYDKLPLKEGYNKWIELLKKKHNKQKKRENISKMRLL